MTTVNAKKVLLKDSSGNPIVPVIEITETLVDTIANISQTTQVVNTMNSGTISLVSDKSFYKETIIANTTFTFDTTNITLANTKSYTFELCLEMSTVKTLTFPSSVKWQDGETPDMTKTGIYFFAFRTIDAGTTWKGSLQGVWQ